MSVVAIRMYFPSDAVLAISKEGERKPCNSAAVASRRSGESPSHEQGLPADHQQLPQPCLFPCLSCFRLVGYYKCTGSVRKEMKNQLGCNLTKFAAIYSSPLMIRKGMKNYSGAASSPVGVGTAGGKQDGLRL